MSDLWNLMSDNGSPVIQGQAGKPFYHQKGPNIKLGDTKEEAQASQQIIDNSCLCKYPYMRYFYIYAYVDTQDEQLSFLSLDFPQQAQQQNYFPDYTVQQDRGYRWKLLQTTYQYAGCLPHTSDVGVWHTIPLFPYDQQCSSDSQEDPQIPVKNLTFPAPSFIGSKDSSIQQGDEQVSTPFRKDTGPASLMRMLVCSYKCCNGYSGCGVLADDQQSDSQIVCPPGGHFCQAWFTVTWQYSPDNVLHYTSISLPYKASCGQCYLPDQTQLISCTSARILRHRQMLVIDQLVAQTCQECLQKLASDILQNQTPPQVDCRVYRLYQYPVTEQCKFGVPFIVETPQQWADVPQQIVGVGQGCQFNGSHQLQPVIVCNKQAYGVRAFQWAASDNCLQQPVPPDQLTGDDVTGLQCECTVMQDPEITDTSDSVFGDRDSYDPPCNIPDPPPYKYRNLTQGQWVYPQFRHTLFDVYKLKLEPLQDQDGQLQSCIPAWDYTRDSNGDPVWQLVVQGYTDWEIKNSSLYWKLQQRIAQDDQNPAEKSYYRIVRHGCEPQIDEQDKHAVDNLIADPQNDSTCHTYYQVTWKSEDSCVCPFPIESSKDPSSGTCTKWQKLGPMNNTMLVKYNIFPGTWQPFPYQSDNQDRTGWRYVLQGQPDASCPDIPLLPDHRQFMQLYYVAGPWELVCHDTCSNSVQKPSSYKPQMVQSAIEMTVASSECIGRGTDLCGIWDNRQECQQCSDSSSCDMCQPFSYIATQAAEGFFYGNEEGITQCLPPQPPFRDYWTVERSSQTVYCGPVFYGKRNELYIKLQGTDSLFFNRNGTLYTASDSQQVQVQYKNCIYEALPLPVVTEQQMRDQVSDAQLVYTNAAICCAQYLYYQYSKYSGWFAVCQSCDYLHGFNVDVPWDFVTYSTDLFLQQYLMHGIWIPGFKTGHLLPWFILRIANDKQGDMCEQTCTALQTGKPDSPILGGVLITYQVQDWTPICNEQTYQLQGTKPPQQFKADVKLCHVGIDTLQELDVFYYGTAFPSGDKLSLPSSDSQQVSGTIKLSCPYPDEAQFIAYAIDQDFQVLQQDQTGVYQVPQAYCKVKYILPSLRVWQNPNPQVFKYQDLTLLWTGEFTVMTLQDQTQISVPQFIAFSNVDEQITQQVQIQGQCGSIYFSVIVMPQKLSVPQLADVQIQFKQTCCKGYHYYAYILRYDSQNCQFDIPSTTPPLSQTCFVQWTYLGYMHKGIFHKRYYGINGWIPFKGGQYSPFGQQPAVVYIVQSQENPQTFCQSVPDFNAASGPKGYFYHLSDWQPKCQGVNQKLVQYPSDYQVDLQHFEAYCGRGAKQVYTHFLFSTYGGDCDAQEYFLQTESKDLCWTLPGSNCSNFHRPIPEASGLYTVKKTGTLPYVCCNSGPVMVQDSWELVDITDSKQADPSTCQVHAFQISRFVPGSAASSPIPQTWYGYSQTDGKVVVAKESSVQTVTVSLQSVYIDGYKVQYYLLQIPSKHTFQQYKRQNGCQITFPDQCYHLKQTAFAYKIQPCQDQGEWSKNTVQLVYSLQDGVCNKGTPGIYYCPDPRLTIHSDSCIQPDDCQPVSTDQNGTAVPSQCRNIYVLQFLQHCPQYDPPYPSQAPAVKVNWDVCKAYTVFYITFAKGSYKCTTDVNIDDPQATTCQWSKSGPFMKYDDNGNLNYQNVPGEGFYADYNLDNLPWSSVPFDSDGRTLKPQKCDSFYYVRVVQHCITQQPVSPTDCPPKRDVNWDVCGCRIKVLRIGPFDDWWLNTSGHPNEWALCPKQLGPYPFDWTVYLFYRNAKRTVGWAKSRATYEIHDYDCTKIACPLSILTQTRDDIGVVSDYGEKYYGLYTDQFILYHSGGQSNYVSCNVNAKNAYMQYAICYQYCQDQPTDQQMLSRIIGDLSDDSRQLALGWQSASLHPTVFCSQQAQYFCGGYRYSGSFTLSSAQLTSQYWNSQDYNYQCHPEWNMTTSRYQGLKYVMKDVCQSGHSYSQQQILICTDGETCYAWQQGNWDCYTAPQDDYCDCSGRGSGQRIWPMFRYQRKNDQGQYVQCTCEEALCLQDGRLSGYLSSDMIYWLDQWQPIQYTITSGKDDSGTWGQLHIGIDQFSWEKETESQTTDEYESQPGCLDTFTYYSKIYRAMQVSGSFTLRHTTPA